MRARLVAAWLLWLATPPACSSPVTAPVPPAIGAGDAYDALYPQHVDLCALTQIRPVGASAGGSAGHAVMFLTGACRRKDAPIPLLEVCEGSSGIGVSVNKMFKNVNWVAIPGARLFFDGNLSPGERLTRERLEASVREAVELGLFRGVEVHRAQLDPQPDGPISEERVARESIGTDYALRYGRTVFCAKLPVTWPMLDEVVTYLNALNLRYASGEADYDWSGYHDNCTHTLHNALASAGVWKPLAVNAVKLRQIFHLAVPANEFVNLAALGNEAPPESFGKLYRDAVRRESLLRHGWLPTRHGVLAETRPVHEPNDLYDTRFRIFVFQPLLLKTKTRQARRMLSERRYVEIEANLRHFEARYAAILAERPEEPPRSGGAGDFEATRRRYYAYIEEQLRDVETKLRRLAALQAHH